MTQHEVLLDAGVDATAKSDEIDALFRGGPVADRHAAQRACFRPRAWAI